MDATGLVVALRDHIVDGEVVETQPLLFNQPSRLALPLTLLLDVLSSAFGTDRATRSNRITERDHRSQNVIDSGNSSYHRTPATGRARRLRSTRSATTGRTLSGRGPRTF